MDSRIMLFVGLGVILVLFLVMTFVSNKRQKKAREKEEETFNALKPGDKVYMIDRTVGFIVSIETDEIGDKYVNIETGAEGRKSTITYDVKAIYSVLKKAGEPDQVFEDKAEEVKEDDTAVEIESDRPEEQPAIEENAEEKKENE